MNICGAGVAAPWEPEEAPHDYVPCCMGSALDGPQGCTCWEPVFDLQQQTIRPETLDRPRDTACTDCAYRADSPERAEGEGEDLEQLVRSGDIFWCHTGIRCVIEYRHPDGRVHVAEARRDYRPPMKDARPFKADGAVADVCAGWWARFEKLDRAVRETA